MNKIAKIIAKYWYGIKTGDIVYFKANNKQLKVVNIECRLFVKSDWHYANTLDIGVETENLSGYRERMGINAVKVKNGIAQNI